MKLLMLALFLSACKMPMSNDQIISESKKCKDSGMKAEALRNLVGEIDRVQCEPKDDSHE